MRRFAVILFLMLFLCGCSRIPMKEPVNFYYVRTEFAYGNSESVLQSEEREASGHTDEIEYLLTLYFTEPISPDLQNPFPEGMELLDVSRSGSGLTIFLSNTTQTLSDSSFSLACAALGQTCLELTDAEAVTIISGSRSQTIQSDSVLLVDAYIP